MIIDFPYEDVKCLKIPDQYYARLINLPENRLPVLGQQAVRRALSNPVGSLKLRELSYGKRRILIAVDDNTRPTPVYEFISLVLNELKEAGIEKHQIQFIMALGTHRQMSTEEIENKLGQEVVNQYRVHNHNWSDSTCLEYIGNTGQGIPVRINKMVTQSDLIIGIGSIMPIDICGFTGGGKIIVPGLSGEQTVDEMHWKRIDVPSSQISGKADNPIRTSIDTLAEKAGLKFIVNVILNGEGKIVGAVTGDMVKAHRAGCEIAVKVFEVKVPVQFDIVIADSYPFDIEFWQANKALDTAGKFVKQGGTIILVSPCYEGISRTHAAEILKHGYLPVSEIKNLVQSGKIKHKVVGVHMYQVSSVAVEKAQLILVSSGVSREHIEKMGFPYAADPQGAFEFAVMKAPKSPAIAVLKGASRMLARKN